MLAARLGKGINYQLLGMCGPRTCAVLSFRDRVRSDLVGSWVAPCGEFNDDTRAQIKSTIRCYPRRVSRLLVSSEKRQVSHLRYRWAHGAQARRGELLRDPQASATSHAVNHDRESRRCQIGHHHMTVQYDEHRTSSTCIHRSTVFLPVHGRKILNSTVSFYRYSTQVSFYRYFV